MKINEVQERILTYKKKHDICILAHSYQAREIIEVADFTGDSYQLSVAAGRTEHKTVVMCGVRFMAETVKILSPGKTVFLANPIAGCPMADQMSTEKLSVSIERYPGHAVVCYINTTAEVKAMSDVCVTSSSAVGIIRAMKNPDILFIPDCNLGAYVAKQVPEKNIRLVSGGCPVHAAVSFEDVRRVREEHPRALLLVHPECVPDVVDGADFVGSTSAIMEYAKTSENLAFIIGTEISIAEHLQYAMPDKQFYYLSKKLICPNMKTTTLMDLYHCVRGCGGEEIIMAPELIAESRKCIGNMILLGEDSQKGKQA